MTERALQIAKDLISCPSVTPVEGGAIPLIVSLLDGLGFECEVLVFEDVTNLYARIGKSGPNFCFMGHVDVVPPGSLSAWRSDPFTPTIRDDCLYGRGANDMKTAIACFIAAVEKFLKAQPLQNLSISLLLTSDEEGTAVNGVRKVVKWLADKGEKIDTCLLGEPCSVKRLGDTLKIGRTGSLNTRIIVTGEQGHVAGTQGNENPIHHLIQFLHALTTNPLDDGTENFAPSRVQVTSIDVGNKATNIVPTQATAAFNIRFNDAFTGEKLQKHLQQLAATNIKATYDIEFELNGDAQFQGAGLLAKTLAKIIEKKLGIVPTFSTAGGTSDARFLPSGIDVVELGFPLVQAHQVNEHVRLEDINSLEEIFFETLEAYKIMDLVKKCLPSGA
jgi:succinyl-diaminopimelate desuccinylase